MRHLLLLSAALFILPLSGCGKPPAPPPPAAEETAPPVIDPASLTAADEARAALHAGDYPAAISASDRALRLDSRNFNAWSARGLAAALAGQPEEGIRLIGKALALSPDFVQGWYDMAIAQKLGGHYTESIAFFQKVIAADPQNTWSCYGIAANYADLKDRDRAVFYLSSALSLDRGPVSEAARTQDHFLWLHGDPAFEALFQP